MSRDLIKEAITELANDQLGRQFPDAITAAQALEHVDDKLAQCWLASNGYGHSLLIGIVERQFSEDASRDALASLLNAMSKNHEGAAAQVGRMFLQAMRLHIAEDLAFRAQQQYEAWEPTDAEMARQSFGSWVDDPVGADRKVIARKYSHV